VAVNAPLLLPMEIGEGETAHREVYQRLREALLAGQLPPGQPISIRYLAQMLAVSTTPVREALRRLEADRAVVSGANRTLTVPLLSLADLREIRNIRLALEGLATEEAAGLVSGAELDELERQCVAMDAAAASHDFDGYLQSNWRFHRVIYGASRSDLLMAMIESLWLRVGPYIRLALPRQGHLRHSMSCHWTALAALRRRDPAAARAAIGDDISGAADDLGRLLVDRQAPAGGDTIERNRT
jgi:DNA-binding GntR family transcriptional regulator